MLPTANAIKASDLLIEQCHSAYCVINNKSTVDICYLIHSYVYVTDKNNNTSIKYLIHKSGISSSVNGSITS